MGGLKLGLNGLLKLGLNGLHQKLVNCLCETLNRATIGGGCCAYAGLAAAAVLAVVPSNDRKERESKRRRKTARSGCAKGRGDDAVPEQGCSTPVLCRSSAEEAPKNPPEPWRTGRRRRRVSRDAWGIARDGRRWIWSAELGAVPERDCCA
ncbi:hypothetical protein U1Q18_021012 [Sarracenia purpurea var. burkii]